MAFTITPVYLIKIHNNNMSLVLFRSGKLYNIQYINIIQIDY